MNKLIIKSLELAGFKNANEIMTVISATPNPTAAAEMILGIFEPTDIDTFGRYWKGKHSGEMLMITTMNDLTNQVNVVRYAPKKVQTYFPTKEDYDATTNGTLDRPKEYYSTKHVPVNGITQTEELYEIDQLIGSYKSVTKYEFDEVLDTWYKPELDIVGYELAE